MALFVSAAEHRPRHGQPGALVARAEQHGLLPDEPRPASGPRVERPGRRGRPTIRVVLLAGLRPCQPSAHAVARRSPRGGACPGRGAGRQRAGCGHGLHRAGRRRVDRRRNSVRTWPSPSIPRSRRPTTSRRSPGGTTTGWSSQPGPGSSTARFPWPSGPWPRCSPTASTTTWPTCGRGWSRPRWPQVTWKRRSGSSSPSRPPPPCSSPPSWQRTWPTSAGWWQQHGATIPPRSKPTCELESPGSTTFGAVGLAARAKEDLARWLATQGRGDEAADLREQARSTYQEIGALGWLTQLDTQLPNRVGAGAGAAWSAAAGTEGLALRQG